MTTLRDRLETLTNHATEVLRRDIATGNQDLTPEYELAWSTFELVYWLGHMDLVPPAHRPELFARACKP